MYKYEVIAEQIREKIINSEFKVNEKLPDEKTLANMFNCSRMTLKQAMDILVSQGYIIKSRGSGTYVRPRYESNQESKLYSDYPSKFGFSNTFEGYNRKTNIIEFNVIPCSKDIANKLQLNEGDFVYHIERVRFIDDNPIILEKTYIPIDKITGITRDVLEKSIYKYIEEELKIKIYNADKIIRAKIANDKDIQYLGIKEGDPVIEMEHVVYSSNSEPIEYAIIHYRGDIYELHLITMKE